MNNIKEKNNQKKVFRSKAKTLKFLEKNLKQSKIEKLYFFSVDEWNHDKKSIIKNILKLFKSSIIVRSSAEGEDSEEKSFAGNYESILDVNIKSKIAITDAITKVKKSYDSQGNVNRKNQIIIQNQTKNVLTSGVIFTRDTKYDLPYFIINFEDNSKTDIVTGGKSNHSIKIFRNTPHELLPKKWKALIRSVKEIEKILDSNYLDIEFGINKNLEIIIFQVRPITTIKHQKKNLHDTIVRKNIKNNKIIFKNLQKSTKEFGNKTFFSDMTDWNPAEIIGTNPNLLDYSLYNNLIMKDSWLKGRSVIGYHNSKQKKLMVKFGNKPYVDIRASFNSLIPSNFENKIKRKLIAYYLEKLKNNPHLHDKVEFDILFTCYDFSLDKRLQELKKYGFKNTEIIKIKEKLLEFTNSIIKKYPEILEISKTSLKIMEENRIKTLNDIKHSSNYVELLKASEKLLDDCKKYGTIPFSTMARIAFVATTLLKSLVNQSSINIQDLELIMNSINSPLSQFRTDYENYYQKKISRKNFLKKYGHLRPGTYDITANRYDHSNKFLDNVIKIKSSKNNLEKKIDVNINEIIKKHGLNFNQKLFFDFIKSSLRNREELKFEFTHNLSDALELIAKAGKILGFTRNDLKDLDINLIKKSYKKYDKNKLRSVWKKNIIQHRKKMLGNNEIILPSLIFNENDFQIIPSRTIKPNFITKKLVTGNVINLKEFNVMPDLEQKIILIENADPGFDWIFTKNPIALITKFGGIASHMSIRCAEISLPAAIGCGEILFEQLISSSKILLDCKNNQIEILENKIDDEYVEERKALKSLGYIK